MRFLIRFLILNKVLVQDLIEILISEQSHWDSQWEKQNFCKGYTIKKHLKIKHKINSLYLDSHYVPEYSEINHFVL